MRRLALAVTAALLVTLLGPLAAARAAGPIVITTQPHDVTVLAGTEASFTAVATDDDGPVPVLRWQRRDPGGSWADLPSSGGSPYAFMAVAADDQATFRAVFAEAGGIPTEVSDASVLTVQEPPTITTGPTAQSVARTGTFTLTAAATGLPTPTVQWQRAASATGPWTAVSGATDPTYTGSPTSYDPAWFRAAFQNPAGTATTAAAKVTVLLDPPAAPVRLAARPGNNSIGLTWDYSRTGAPWDTWKVEIRNGAGAVVRALSIPTNPAAPSRSTQVTVSAGTYTVRLAAANAAGTSAWIAAGPVVVTAAVRTLTTSGSVLRPFKDGFQDRIDLIVHADPATAATLRILDSRNRITNSWALATGSSWVRSWNGRAKTGKPVAYGRYRAELVVGGAVLATRTVSVKASKAGKPHLTSSLRTVYPARDGYADRTQVTVTNSVPVRSTVTITGNGGRVFSKKLPRRLAGSFGWDAHKGGKALPAGKYRVSVTSQAGEGRARTATLLLRVSGQRVVAKTFDGTISAQDAHLTMVSGSYSPIGADTVGLWSSPALGSDIAIFRVKLPGALRYGSFEVRTCANPNVSNPAAEAALIYLTPDLKTTGRGYPVGADDGCYYGSKVSGQLVSRAGTVAFAVGNVGENFTWQYIDYFRVTGTRYVLE